MASTIQVRVDDDLKKSDSLFRDLGTVAGCIESDCAPTRELHIDRPYYEEIVGNEEPSRRSDRETAWFRAADIEFIIFHKNSLRRLT